MSNFSERFGLEVDMEESREQFINRVCNGIFDEWDNRYSNQHPVVVRSILSPIASELGKRYFQHLNSICDYINTKDYLEVLRGVEAIYNIYKKGSDDNMRLMIDIDMNDHIIAKSELDLGIRWENGKFIRTGAKLLDDKLVKDPLKWLRKNGHSTVVEPFEKALQDFLKIELRNESLSDVIKDAYEALEALAKIILDNNQELSKNREKFVSKIKGKEFHKEILRQYVIYGCDYRHGSKPKSPRPQPSKAEAEFFLYFTGTVLRLAMENWEGS